MYVYPRGVSRGRLRSDLGASGIMKCQRSINKDAAVLLLELDYPARGASCACSLRVEMSHQGGLTDSAGNEVNFNVGVNDAERACVVNTRVDVVRRRAHVGVACLLSCDCACIGMSCGPQHSSNGGKTRKPSSDGRNRGWYGSFVRYGRFVRGWLSSRC